MHPSLSELSSVPVLPLTAEAFAPFGEVVPLDGDARRVRAQGAFERLDGAIEPRLWIATLQQAVTLPLVVTTLERHPLSAQTFIPLNGCAYVVVVCGAAADGTPDPATLRAFQATPAQGVTYARGVWHHGLAALNAPARFVVCMSFSGRDDDVFVPLSRPVRLVAGEARHG
jgi:ureidoglycolate lyase